MSRSAEFGVGATFKQKDQYGNETTRSAVEAVGGRRDGAQAGMLPPVLNQDYLDEHVYDGM
jgi:hypothetical protein